MENHTVALLKECSKGCKMAIDSINHLSEYVRDPGLKTVVESYKEKHQTLDKESSKSLAKMGYEEKEPGIMAATFAKVTTEMKMMMEKDERQISKILMNGCNMGIQSISEAITDNNGANEESIGLAKDLIETEEDFMEELKSFL